MNEAGLPWLVFLGDTTDSFTGDWLRSSLMMQNFLGCRDYCTPVLVTRQMAPVLAAQAMVVAATAGDRG